MQLLKGTIYMFLLSVSLNLGYLQKKSSINMFWKKTSHKNSSFIAL